MRALLTVLLLALVASACSASTRTEPAPAPAPASASTTTPAPVRSASPTPSLLMEPDLRRVGRLFLAFADGRRDTPPSDTPVDLLLGSRRLTTLDGSRLADRDAWRLCPQEGSYAARICPFSAIDVLGEHDGRIRMTTEPPDHPCMARADKPYRGRWLTLEPAGNATCVDWFAVVLQVNDVAQVTAVDLVQAEP